MGLTKRSMATLRLFGDDLIPEKISELLLAQPTHACRKGQALVGRVTNTSRLANTGAWQLCASEQAPENIDSQIIEILDQLTADLSVWTSIAHFNPDLFCGAFMASANDGLDLSADTLLALGLRGIALKLDLYQADN